MYDELYYREKIADRILLRSDCESNSFRQIIEYSKCREDIKYFINNHCWTYDPRLVSTNLPEWIPFDLWPRQCELIDFIENCLNSREDGIVPKSRDIGHTWLTGAYALHKWLFVNNFKTTFASRKCEYVDRLGDPASIFERIRMLIKFLPTWFLPTGFNYTKHDNYMRLINPVNGSVIRGEGGDEIGRGDRSTIMFLDEAAFFEHAERIEAATSANTDVRIWGSTSNGNGTLFSRKRLMVPPERIFTFHWSDDPRKSPEWAAKKKADVGEVIFASEYDINDSASVEGICIPAMWVQSCVDFGKRFDVTKSNRGIAGLDVGVSKDKSVFVARFGNVVLDPVSWGETDTTETAYKALDKAQELGVAILNFDSVGVGAGVDATLKRAQRRGLTVAGINVGVAPSETTVWPDGQTSKEKFFNRKAELWFLLRERIKHTHEFMLWVDKLGGREHPISDLLALPSGSKDAQILAYQISLPKYNRNENGKIQMERKAALALRGIKSPDHAEALVLTFEESNVLDVLKRAFGLQS